MKMGNEKLLRLFCECLVLVERVGGAKIDLLWQMRLGKSALFQGRFLLASVVRALFSDNSHFFIPSFGWSLLGILMRWELTLSVYRNNEYLETAGIPVNVSIIENLLQAA